MSPSEPQRTRALRLYNTRTRKVERFAPLRDDHVRVYVCGLTPSAEAHLGHARSFMFFDVLRRYLVDLGYRVTFVQNVTDIDDRSIDAAKTSGRNWRDIVNGYFDSFKRSMTRLHVLEPDHEPRDRVHRTDFGNDRGVDRDRARLCRRRRHLLSREVICALRRVVWAQRRRI